MLNRSFTTDTVKSKSQETGNYHGRESRARVRFHRSGMPSVSRRLEEMDMSMSDYLRHLVQKDIGVFV